LLAFMDVATRRLRVVYVLWLAAVCASTVLTHRHHLLDVAAGLAITFAIRSWRLRQAATAPSTKPPSWIGAAR
jgi:membrane-associated phospholipid phosphatase